MRSLVLFLIFSTHALAQTTARFTRAQAMEVVRQVPMALVVNKAAQGHEAQTLSLYENGIRTMRIPVSTGSETRMNNYPTPVGVYRPWGLFENWFSGQWRVNLPNAIFFQQGFAIHAVEDEAGLASLGQRASKGCVRVSLVHSRILLNKVSRSGGATPRVEGPARRRRIVGTDTPVSALARLSGQPLPRTVMSWDVAVVVYQD